MIMYVVSKNVSVIGLYMFDTPLCTPLPFVTNAWPSFSNTALISVPALFDVIGEVTENVPLVPQLCDFEG